MAKYKDIKVDVFKKWILVFAGDFKEFKVWCKNRLSSQKTLLELIETDKDKSCSLGTTYYNSCSGESVIWLKYFPHNPSTTSILTHEIYHAACGVLDFCGIKDEETYAYLIEHLIYEALKKDDWITVKKG